MLLNGGRDAVGNIVYLVNDGANFLNRFDGAAGIALDGQNFVADLFGGLSGLLGEFFDFIGDYGKAFARLARPGSLNSGVQG